MVRIHHGAARIRWTLVASLVATGALLAACGSSSSSTTTTTAASGSTATTSGGSSTQLQTFGGSLRSAKNATFKAVYTSTSSDGSTQTITLEQSPPKQVFATTDSSGTVSTLLNTGTTTYSCTTESGSAPTCTSLTSSVGAGALSALIGVYDGSSALTAIEGWQTIVAAHLTGVSLTFTDSTIAGQSVRCANWKYHGSSATYCVTDKGVLAKVVSSDSSGSASASSFELTSFTTSPPASDFELPAGATVVTIPTGA